MADFTTGHATDFTFVGTETDPTDPLPDIEDDGQNDEDSPSDQTNYAEPGQGESFAGQDPSIWSIQGDADDGSTFQSSTPAIETETLPTDGDEPDSEPLEGDNPAVEDEEEWGPPPPPDQANPQYEEGDHNRWWDDVEGWFNKKWPSLSMPVEIEGGFDLTGGFKVTGGVELADEVELRPLFKFQRDQIAMDDYIAWYNKYLKSLASDDEVPDEDYEADEELETDDQLIEDENTAGPDFEDSPQDISEVAYTGTQQEQEPELDPESDEEMAILAFYSELQMLDPEDDLLSIGEVVFAQTSLVEFVDLELAALDDEDGDGFTNFVDDSDEDFTI